MPMTVKDGRQGSRADLDITDIEHRQLHMRLAIRQHQADINELLTLLDALDEEKKRRIDNE